MKKLYITLLFTIYNLISYGQITFQDGYGQFNEDKGQIVIATVDGRYCIIGSTGADLQDSSDIAVYFLNNFGDLILSYRISLPGDDFPEAAIETNDGGFIIVGKTYSSPLDTVNADVFAVKIDNQNASIIWANVYGGIENDEAYSIIPTPEGRFLISGNTKSFGTASQSAFALKIDQNGDPLWCNVNSIDPINNLYSCDNTSDNKYVMTGYTRNGNNFDHYTLKMDTSGTVIWGRKDGTNQNEIGNDIKTTSDHGFIVVGSSTSNSGGNIDQTVLKMDSTGSITWSFKYGGPQDDELTSVIETSSNNFVACGTTDIDSTVNVLNQMVIEEISSSGNIIWSNTYGDTIGASEGYCIIIGLDGGYTSSGMDKSSDPAGESFLVKTDANGMSGCNEFPIQFTSNLITLSNSTNAIQQHVVMNMSPVFMTVDLFTDQFTQNCFWDNILKNNSRSLLNLYPNPAENTIQIESALSNSTLTIFDGLGQIVYQNKLNYFRSSVDIAFLSPGIYFVEVNNDKSTSNSKFVKQ